MKHHTELLMLAVVGMLGATGLRLANAGAGRDTPHDISSARKLFDEIRDWKWHYENLIRYDEVIRRAQEIAQEARNVDMSLEAQSLIVNCYRQQGEYRKMNEAFSKWIYLLDRAYGAEKAAQVIKRVGDEYFNSGEYLDARDVFRILFTKYPKDKLAPHAQYMIAQVAEVLCRDSRDKEPVVAQYEKLIQKYANTEWGERGSAKLELLYMKMGQVAKVIELNRAYVTKHPKGKTAASRQYLMGSLLLAQKRRYEALQEFRKVLENYPESDVAPMAEAYIEKIK